MPHCRTDRFLRSPDVDPVFRRDTLGDPTVGAQAISDRWVYNRRGSPVRFGPLHRSSQARWVLPWRLADHRGRWDGIAPPDKSTAKFLADENVSAHVPGTTHGD
jgi:hypothetical protein